ncbi:hypothetical protein BN14_09054 [Rhizoctonia solani AG-1 IB]|uniref:Jacalin-type lectin domain-containing protein n=1 Tax=Thanatephorus cucumeris (strain AG1-IB / isolate 7/3/14) TaxID=1108050 RepID=M5C4Q7_THACB|nr:hypothetical protein BN14_09054 [Rhizoctonia solani AG-1 IB]
MSNQAEDKATASFWSILQKEKPSKVSFEYGLRRPGDSDYVLPEDSDFLRGFTFNGPNGPYKCSRQVSRVRSAAIYSLQRCSDISTEEFYPANDRDARYVHMGWPAPSELRPGPMDAMYGGPKAPSNQNGLVCRRMVIHRWTISCRKEDLEPTKEFVKAVEEVLKLSDATEQKVALREIFAAWGEMVPLCAVIGASLAATGTLVAKQTLTGDTNTFRPPNRGPDVMQMVDQNLDITDSSPTWEVVKVNRGASIIDILPQELQQKVNRALSQQNSIWRTPSVLPPIPFDFDGASLGVKDIKQINIWHNGAGINDFSIVYVDGTTAGPYGSGKTSQMSDSFLLARGEYITDIFAWNNGGFIITIQFAKNTYQLSPRYGVHIGWGSNNSNYVRQLQGVWHSGSKQDDYRAIATSTIGMGNGTMFNDYRFLGHPATSRISAIQYRNTAQAIAQFQVTYSSSRNGTQIKETTPIRGTDPGARDTWNLEDDEYITQVSGRYNGTAIYRLEFTTNKGITKRIGQEFGEWFTVLPPKKGMILYYLLGKTVGYIQTLTFVWGAPPLKEEDA